MDWARDGKDWPHRERSRFESAGGVRWHVQQWPAPHAGAPQWLLLHGTGASAHSWRGLAPLLAARVGVVAIDLPGHAFSSAGAASMHEMASSVHALLAAMVVAPEVIVGHSAGAAIGVRMALQEPSALRALVGLNAAMLPLGGVAGRLFSPAAKLLALNPLVPHFFSWHAADRVVLKRLLDSTGSKLDDTGTALYRRLIGSPAHVAGALAMMARWDLPALAADLPQLSTPLHLLAAELDGTIPPADARRVQTLVPGSTLTPLPALGHLAHEENPAGVAELLLQRLALL